MHPRKEDVMSKLEFEITSIASDGVVDVFINGVEYRYLGVNTGVLNRLRWTYRLRTGVVLNWLKKNSRECHKIEKGGES